MATDLLSRSTDTLQVSDSSLSYRATQHRRRRCRRRRRRRRRGGQAGRVRLVTFGPTVSVLVTAGTR